MRNLSTARVADAPANGQKPVYPEKAWRPHQTVRRAVATSLAAWAAIMGAIILFL